MTLANKGALQSLLRDSWRSFLAHDGKLLAAGVAFYALLALAPLFVIAAVVVGVVLGDDVAAGGLREPIEATLGPRGADLVVQLMAELREPASTGLATVLSVLFVLYGSMRLFVALKSALNQVWGVRVKPGVEHYGLTGAAWLLLRRRMASFVMVLLFSAAMLLLLILKAVLAYAAHAIGDLGARIPVSTPLEMLASFVVSTLLLSAIFRLLPDARIAWGDALRGACVTAVLVGLGGSAIGLYLGRASPESAYGAAGSVVVVLLWVYYTAQVFFFGAELTGLYAERHGGGIHPLEHAVRGATLVDR